MNKLLPVLFSFLPYTNKNTRRNPGLVSRSGSVLVVCLWVVAVLLILVLALNNNISVRIRFAKHFRDTHQAELIAKAGIFKSLAELKKNSISSWYDCLNEPWCNSPELFNEITLGEGTYTISYEEKDPGSAQPEEGGKSFGQGYGDKLFTNKRYGMLDEERKISINRNWTNPLRDLFKYLFDLVPGEAQDIANAIADWRDQDDQAREGGAENSYYQSLENPYPCKNKNFQILEELLLVRGITPPMFEQVKDYLTIYGSGKVNINTAPFTVLMGLGLTEDLARKVIRFRAGVDGEEGTPDDNICTKATKFVSQISQVEALTPEEKQLLNNLIIGDYITIGSSYYRIKSEGEYRNFSKEINCIAWINPQKKVKIVAWLER